MQNQNDFTNIAFNVDTNTQFSLFQNIVRTIKISTAKTHCRLKALARTATIREILKIKFAVITLLRSLEVNRFVIKTTIYCR